MADLEIVSREELIEVIVELRREVEVLRRENEELRRGKTETELAHHLRNRGLKDKDNQRLLNGIGLQDDRGNVLLFLRHPEIEPANNRAEGVLRPAVIARKVSQCSKNQRGAYAFAAFVSLAQTFRKNPAVSVTQAFLGLFCNRNSTVIPL